MFELMKIGEVVVNVDANGRYCLNDLHKASGGNAKHAPALWLRASSTADLIQELINESESLCKIQNRILEQNQPLSVVHGGNLRGTYACKELVYAYAMWISPSFNLRVIRAFDNIQQVKQQTQGAVDLEDPEFLQGLLMKYAEDKKRLTQEKAQLESKVIVQEEVISITSQQLEEAAPKVEFVDKYVEASGLLGFREVAKMLGVKEAVLRAWLVDTGAMYRLGAGWAFKAQWLDAKRGVHKTSYDVYGRAVVSAKFTPKGFAYIAERISK